MTKRRRVESTTNPGGKYQRIYDYLAAHRDEQEITLSFAEIALLTEGALPHSARVHRSWWANSYRTSQSRAWLSAGFHTENVRLDGEHVTFVRGE